MFVGELCPMITPSFSITATERVLPKLALDFTTASLDPRITFTRALNTATKVNSSGFIETVNADTPRFDYDPITKVCKGLLIEESRTNQALQSENLTTTWTRTGVNAFGSPAASPANTNTAYAVIENTSGGGHFVRQDLVFAHHLLQ